MTNANDVRRAHDLLDELDARAELSQEQEKLLRSFLPELPKQTPMEEISAEVKRMCNHLEVHYWLSENAFIEWLEEIHSQLQEIIDTEPAPANTPALPAGMRIAVHAVYGRVVVSPVVDDDGTCKIFHLSTHARDGSDYCWAPIDSLTFIDYEPAKPAHPEFLETEADYAAAPEGTIVASAENLPCHKFHDKWSSVDFIEMKDDKGMSRFSRRVLRWGWV